MSAYFAFWPLQATINNSVRTWRTLAPLELVRTSFMDDPLPMSPTTKKFEMIGVKNQNFEN